MSVKEDLKIEFKVEYYHYGSCRYVSRKYLVSENGKWKGEYISYYENGQVYIHAFYVDGKAIGIWTHYNEDGSLLCKYFYSFENPGNLIEENEYKRQLAKIRLGIWKVPALDLKISDYEH